MNIILNILTCLFGGFIAGAIITTIISLHIEIYCEKIGVDITKNDEKSLLGIPVPPNENRKKLYEYTSKLLIIYT